jgi:hypothetical protein
MPGTMKRRKGKGTKMRKGMEEVFGEFLGVHDRFIWSHTIVHLLNGADIGGGEGARSRTR